MRPEFRIWHKTEKKMYQLEGIDLTDRQGNYGYIVEWDNYGTIYNSIPKEDAELMQFTDLLDKNGKEIYVDDIVRHSNGMLSHIEDIHDFCGDAGIYGDYADDVEIIGNIHEQPELIEQH